MLGAVRSRIAKLCRVAPPHSATHSTPTIYLSTKAPRIVKCARAKSAAPPYPNPPLTHIGLVT